MDKRIRKIIENYFDGGISDSETKELIAWVKNGNEDVFNDYVHINFLVDRLKQATDGKSVASWKKIDAAINKNTSEKTVSLYGGNILKYAAAILLFVFSGYYLLVKKNTAQSTGPVIVGNIEAGTSKAVLTLGNGDTISLGEGRRYSTYDLTSDDGELVYSSKKSVKAETAYNYLTIPRGGQHFIKLSDGTRVWLNSETKIRYPVAFQENKTREVELMYGEAYFEVSSSTLHNGSRFKVINSTQQVEVLGTEFNIKAYKDETSVYTTLVEGAVVVGYNGKEQGLVPGQQSTWSSDENSFLVKKANVYNEISWKKGVFSFEGKPLKEIMKILSRWYDVDIVFLNKAIEKAEFDGVLRKNKNLEDVLLNIKNFGIIEEYTIEGKTIMLK